MVQPLLWVEPQAFPKTATSRLLDLQLHLEEDEIDVEKDRVLQDPLQDKHWFLISQAIGDVSIFLVLNTEKS